MLALQHRGQDAAGIAVSNGDDITVIKERGLVTEALDHGQALVGLRLGEFATGHVRYSTNETATQEQQFRAAQPMFGEQNQQYFTVSQNGHLIDVDELRARNPEDEPVTDSELIVQRIGAEMARGNNLQEAVVNACRGLNGAYTLVVMGQNELIGLRDPNGFRPLKLGTMEGGGSVLASEDAALDIVKSDIVREVKPGELVRITREGVESNFPFGNIQTKQNLCAFEYVYFSRPDNELLGENVEQVRFRMGQQLAIQAPVDADIVIGVPKSGISAAYGFVDVSKIPIKQGLTKNEYVGRSFIAPTQEQRQQTAHIKLNVNQRIVENQRVVVVDDSIIRSTTTATMVKMLRDKGAAEVHLRISSPPYKWPCFYGMGTGKINELIAASMTQEEIRAKLEVDSLAYLSLEGLERSIGKAAGKVCTACITGNYPTHVPARLLKKS